MIENPPTPGTALWVHAHPRQQSLGNHLFRAGAGALSATHEVLTSDLYAEGFDPVLSERDLGDLAGTPGQHRGSRSVRPSPLASLPDDVRAEQAKLAAAELLVIQFPLWWYGPPAILKGWFDRVLTAGFAYGDMDPELDVPRRYGDGGPRRTQGARGSSRRGRTSAPSGRAASARHRLAAVPLTHGTLWYTGIETLDLHRDH